MSWITEYVKPQLNKLLGVEDKTPENVWIKCPDTGMIIHQRELTENLYISTHSDHHFIMPVAERIKMLFDNGIFERIETPAGLEDPLGFKDNKKYTDRLRDSRAKTGEQDAIFVASGTIKGNPAVVAAFNFSFMGGSMGTAVGEGIVTGAELAVKNNAAFITIPASGGARMQEGIMSLMQMARTTVAINKVKDAKLPYLVLLTNPTTGGVSASFAMLGDVHIAEPKCMIGFAGRRVIEQTVRENLPEGFQTAEYLVEHGMVDMVIHRKELKDTMGRLIDLMLVKRK